IIMNFRKFIKPFISGIMVILVFNTSCSKKTAGISKHENADSIFKVIGYLPNRTDLLAAANQVDYAKITHLYIAFINPDSLGNLTRTENLREVATLTHSRNVKIMASIGGGSAPKYYPSFLIGEKKTKLINDLVNLAVTNNLDGIDVDLEGALID